MRFSIRQVSAVLGLDDAGHRALRFAADMDVLRFGEIADGRGTKTFPASEIFRAAVFMALQRVGIAAVYAARHIEVADRPGPHDLHAAIIATGDREPWQFRVHTRPDGQQDAAFAPLGAPLPGDAESVLVIDLTTIWTRPFDHLSSLPETN